MHTLPCSDVHVHRHAGPAKGRSTHRQPNALKPARLVIRNAAGNGSPNPPGHNPPQYGNAGPGPLPFGLPNPFASPNPDPRQFGSNSSPNSPQFENPRPSGPPYSSPRPTGPPYSNPTPYSPPYGNPAPTPPPPFGTPRPSANPLPRNSPMPSPYTQNSNGTPPPFPFPFSPQPEPSFLHVQQQVFKASGRTVVVTGGSQGIGRATALLFARKGYNVVVAARNEQKLQYVADDCANAAGRQGSSLAVRCDVTDERDVRNLVNQVFAKFESVDAVINNAGVFVNGAFLDTPAEEARRVMDVNYLGAYMVMQSFMPVLLSQAKRRSGADRPSIINVLSFAGKVPVKNMSAFTASKFALEGLSQAVRAEVEPLGVHVGTVSPGFVKTNAMSQAEFYGDNNQGERRLFRQMMRALPLTQSSQEVADAIYNAVVSKQNEVVVGLPFAAAAEAYRMTGINVSALPFT